MKVWRERGAGPADFNGRQGGPTNDNFAQLGAVVGEHFHISNAHHYGAPPIPKEGHMPVAHKSKKNGSADTTALRHTSASDTIPFAVAVAKGKAIKAQQVAAERNNYLLGEYAHKVVHPTYGDRTLAKYAEAIGEKTVSGSRTNTASISSLPR
jgi:hypothetical protein